jgi:dTDP-4-dehydrorhamnose 3,5-epimerase
MQIESTAIPNVKLIVPPVYSDHRGSFSEIYRSARLASAGIHDIFVQDNASVSIRAGTIRGLHFQIAPHAQAKLVRVSRGRIFDVAVDLRRSSPHFGKHVAAELSDENRAQLYIPAGFAHGFCTMTPDTEVIYKVSHGYVPSADGGVLWSDNALAIEWPVYPNSVTISEKDAQLPRFIELGQLF